METDTTQLMTAGEIARDLKVESHRVSYIIKSRKIQESRRVGNIRLFDADAITTIREELEAA